MFKSEFVNESFFGVKSFFNDLVDPIHTTVQIQFLSSTHSIYIYILYIYIYIYTYNF